MAKVVFFDTTTDTLCSFIGTQEDINKLKKATHCDIVSIAPLSAGGDSCE